jgi:hypothetical protein
MLTFETLLPMAHLLGLALALGSSTVKLTLLVKSMKDHSFVPAYIAAAKPITRLILTGTALLVLSGIIWLIRGYPFIDILIVKLILVAAIFVLGSTIDKVIEPKFLKLAPVPGESPSPEFIRIQKRYLILEVTATGLYYVIVVMWLLF